ncbi:MAG: hypothetical protein ABSA93_15430 [Streptosporangiaceae bacterium]
MIRLSRRSAAIGAVALTTVLAVAGCGSSSTSTGSSSGSSSSKSSFEKCLEQHGVTPPSGGNFPRGGSTASPRPRPTGSRSSSFQQAIQACRG